MQLSLARMRVLTKLVELYGEAKSQEERDILLDLMIYTTNS